MTDRDEEHTNGPPVDDASIDETRHLDHGQPGTDGSAGYVEPHERTGAGPGDRYLIGETLGEGGMAVVYRATDVQLQRQVAVKRLRTEYAAQTDIRQRFFAEAEILVRGIRDYSHHIVIDLEDFFDGNWEFLNASPLSPRCGQPLASDGSVAVAREIVGFLEGQ